MINISLSIFYFSFNFYNKIFSDYIPVHFALYISNFDTLRFFRYVFLRNSIVICNSLIYYKYRICILRFIFR